MKRLVLTVLFAFLLAPIYVDAAFPTISGITYSEHEAANVTTHNVLLPPTIAVNDLICVLGSVDAAPTITWDNATAGTWDQEYEVANSTDMTGLLYCIKSDGTEDGKTLGIGTSSLQRSTWYSFLVAASQWSGTLSTGVFSATGDSGTGTSVNPPNLAPGVGALDFLWIAVAHADGIPTVSVFSEASNQNESTNTDSAAALTAFSSAEANASSRDPAAYTISASEQKLAATIAIRPAAAAATTTLQRRRRLK